MFHKSYLKNSFFSCVVIAALLFLGNSTARAALDNKGTDFIMAFMPNLDASITLELHLTGDVATDVTVDYPVDSPTFTTTVGIVPGDVTIVTIPINAALWTPDAVANNAVHAFATDEFVCYMIHRRTASSDAALALPVDTMNTEYIVMDYNPAFVGAEFAVVAGFDNTTVTITPATNIIGHAAGVAFDVILNRGEGYFARSSSTILTNTLTGSIISADKPVGVTNGDGCTQVPTGIVACDHIFEVAQPVQSWGTRALVANLPNRTGGTIYRILASQDNTTVTQDGVSIGTINRGQFIEVGPITGNHVFEGDNPIYVAQFMTGDGAAGATNGDPAMGNMIPTEQYLSNYTFSTVGGNQFAENFVTVIAEDGDVSGGTILLDGVAIPAADFTAIGTTGFSVAIVELSSGVHNTASNGVHGITVEGYNNFDSYIYPGGALFEFINPTGDANPPICEIEIVAGDPPTATGTATDDRPSEDINGNDVLDDGEDLNGNGQIDEDSGIFFVELGVGAVNLTLTVDPFVPGDDSVSYNVELTDPTINGSGVVIVTDGAGNTCESEIELIVEDANVVSLISFTAKEENGVVLVEWETATEIDTAGFNILRNNVVGSEPVKVNSSLISAEGSAFSGAKYSFVDSQVVSGKAYTYQLEDVETDGDSTIHDAVIVRVGK
ncbi:MAG: hypothetical protein E3K37_07840 [Candidatus Kuenenia sp.]|nr:hypothetical protein [Candidatus Kuenenia hertensis]